MSKKDKPDFWGFMALAKDIAFDLHEIVEQLEELNKELKRLRGSLPPSSS